MSSNTDRIEKQIDLKAPPARIWRALTDHVEFGTWFGVKMESPFVVGQIARGRITHPGYDHLTMEVIVKAMEPEKRFVFTWHPYAIDPTVDYSKETPTTVEFTLEPMPMGTRLRIVESGFDAIPAARRAEAFRMNDGGWTQQVKNIEKHVASTP
jgi:uncharacterized protein YndB with AHSA1/START domain